MDEPESSEVNRSAVAAVVDKINREALTTTQAAAMAGVSAQTMWQWVKAGKVPGFTVAGAVRVWPEDVPTKAAS
jgi:transposase